MTNILFQRLYIVGCCSIPLFSCTGPEEPVPELDTPMIALTPTEYNHTIRDLYGMPNTSSAWPSPSSVGSTANEAWPWYFPEEAGVGGFEGFAQGQDSSSYLVEQYYKAAVHFAAYIPRSPLFFACEDWESLPTNEQKDCAWNSIERFVQRAWRRPLREEEKSRLETFWEQNWSGGTPAEAINLTVVGILQSPAFLFRIEYGQADSSLDHALPLSDWEMASRLSYFLWDSMPDATLFGAAARGELRTAQQVEEQARRMLADERAREGVVHFHNQWLGTTDMNQVSPARRAYGPLYYNIEAEPADVQDEDFDWPLLLLPIRESMKRETNLFVERTIFDGRGRFTDLLTDNHGYMSDLTAPLYGEGAIRASNNGIDVNPDYGSAFTLYPATFPENQRAGVLTLPSTLALLSHPVHPSPILRGKFILTQIACQALGNPPPGAEGEAPPDSLDAESTNRQRTEVATSPAGCAGCHDSINPPGFAFEHYDAMGGWRERDNGLPIDSSGTLTLAGGEVLTFSDAIDLSRQLAASTRVRDCYTRKWVEYATGAQLDAEHAGLLALQEAFQDDDNIQELLVEIARSPMFRHRGAGGAP